MDILLVGILLLISYLLGSIPFGFFIVRWISGKDLRKIESGRTGGTNAVRAAGVWAGIATAFLDIMKGASSVWLVKAILPDAIWLEILAPVLAILGHNYSIFLIERNEQGKIRLRGGAGGTPAAGGVFAFWPPAVFIIVPLTAALLYFGGYASLTTMSLPLLAAIIFTIRALIGAGPWEYLLYCLLAELLLIWALRPNIKRLLNGTERMVGFRARKSKQNSLEFKNHQPM